MRAVSIYMYGREERKAHEKQSSSECTCVNGARRSICVTRVRSEGGNELLMHSGAGCCCSCRALVIPNSSREFSTMVTELTDCGLDIKRSIPTLPSDGGRYAWYLPYRHRGWQCADSFHWAFTFYLVFRAAVVARSFRAARFAAVHYSSSLSLPPLQGRGAYRPPPFALLRFRRLACFGTPSQAFQVPHCRIHVDIYVYISMYACRPSRQDGRARASLLKMYFWIFSDKEKR